MSPSYKYSLRPAPPAVKAAEETRSPEGAEFRDVVGGATAVEATEQTRSPEGVELRDEVWRCRGSGGC